MEEMTSEMSLRYKLMSQLAKALTWTLVHPLGWITNGKIIV